MSKTSGSYETLIRGVSEQVPESRREGQHYAQVNMISDPVRGVARRHGSLFMDEDTLGPVSGGATQQDAPGFLPFQFVSGEKEYDLVYRSQARPTGSVLPALRVFDKAARAWLPTVRPTVDPYLDSLEANGVATLVNVGRYVFLAARGVPTTYTTDSPWGTTPNTEYGAVWVRLGAYSRTFSVTITTKVGTGTPVSTTASYTTMPASYQGVLDTSDIAASDPEYQKKVNDRVNAYNSDVTNYIGIAGQDITPENIASKLRDAFITLDAGWATVLSVQDSTLRVDLTGDSRELVDITATDSGDGTMIRAVGQTVDGVDGLSPVHWVGKIVRVQPEGATADNVYYMRAEPRVEGATGWAEVSWAEAPGATTTPTQVFAFGTVEAGTFYVAGTPEDLETLVPGLDVPEYQASSVGDFVTSPIPQFLGKEITYLDVFQDRLIVCSGAVVFASRPGDYLNWFRQSVLTVPDNDPIEVYAFGAENDVIRAGARFDRSLVLFGEQRQYIINGKQPYIPATASIVTMATHEDAVDASPVSSGNFIFYAKTRNGKVSVHQVQTGLVADAPESYEVTSTLDSFMPGAPIQLLAVTAPNTLLVRTTGHNHGVFVYTYLDSADAAQRLFDSWSRWEWDPLLGYCLGVTSHKDNLFIYTVREGLDDQGDNQWWLVADEFVLDTAKSQRPYLDSARTLAQYQSGTGWLHADAAESLVEAADAAFGAGVREYLLGSPLGLLQELLDAYPDSTGALWLGVGFPAYLTPTNPYVRDSKGQAILTGRHVITKYVVTVQDSGGLDADAYTDSRGTYSVGKYSARVIGRLTAELGIQPTVTGQVSVPIGRAVTEFRYTLKAKTWLPLTVSAIQWVGQFFLNHRRS